MSLDCQNACCYRDYFPGIVFTDLADYPCSGCMLACMAARLAQEATCERAAFWRLGPQEPEAQAVRQRYNQFQEDTKQELKYETSNEASPNFNVGHIPTYTSLVGREVFYEQAYGYNEPTLKTEDATGTCSVGLTPTPTHTPSMGREVFFSQRGDDHHGSTLKTEDTPPTSLTYSAHSFSSNFSPQRPHPDERLWRTPPVVSENPQECRPYDAAPQQAYAGPTHPAPCYPKRLWNRIVPAPPYVLYVSQPPPMSYTPLEPIVTTPSPPVQPHTGFYIPPWPMYPAQYTLAPTSPQPMASLSTIQLLPQLRPPSPTPYPRVCAATCACQQPPLAPYLDHPTDGLQYGSQLPEEASPQPRPLSPPPLPVGALGGQDQLASPPAPQKRQRRKRSERKPESSGHKKVESQKKTHRSHPYSRKPAGERPL